MARRYPLGDIKILWALAAGRCCFPGCRQLCIIEATSRRGAAAIGDIAHIVAHSPTGPRGDRNFPQEALDTYSNWILLCPNHHRIVDAQPATYDQPTLLRWKRDHENWVASQLGAAAPHIAPPPSPTTVTLYRVARIGRDPWHTVTPGAGQPLGRWDDPVAGYAVLYTADSAAAAVAETLAAYRPDPGIFDRMAQFFGEPISVASLRIHPGEIAADLARDRVVARASVTGRFAEIDDLEVRRYIDERVDLTLGSRDVDTSPLGDRRRTQQASRILFETGQFDGIIYSSRAIPGHRMYALFPSARVSPEGEIPMGANLPEVTYRASSRVRPHACRRQRLSPGASGHRAERKPGAADDQRSTARRKEASVSPEIAVRPTCPRP